MTDTQEAFHRIHSEVTRAFWGELSEMTKSEGKSLVIERVKRLARDGGLTVLEFVFDLVERDLKEQLFGSIEGRDEAIGGLKTLGEVRDLLFNAIPSGAFDLGNPKEKFHVEQRGDLNPLERIYG